MLIFYTGSIKQTVGSVGSFNYDDNSMFVRPETEESDDEEILIVAAEKPVSEASRSDPSDSQSLIFMPSLDGSFEKIKAEDEVQASRRYLSINSAPLHRWSYGMIPSVPKRILEHQDRIDSVEHEIGNPNEANDASDNFNVSSKCFNRFWNRFF